MTERGSFQWWAELCRTPTFLAITDSGSAYGYQWEQPLPQEQDPALYMWVLGPNWYEVRSAAAHWLWNVFDAADPVAVALEELLHWLADEKYQGEIWYMVTRAFLRELDQMALCLEKDGTFHLKPYLQRTAPYTRRPFPLKAVKGVGRAGLLGDVPVAPGYNSYNFDNDLTKPSGAT